MGEKKIYSYCHDRSGWANCMDIKIKSRTADNQKRGPSEKIQKRRIRPRSPDPRTPDLSAPFHPVIQMCCDFSPPPSPTKSRHCRKIHIIVHHLLLVDTKSEFFRNTIFVSTTSAKMLHGASYELPPPVDYKQDNACSQLAAVSTTTRVSSRGRVRDPLLSSPRTINHHRPLKRDDRFAKCPTVPTKRDKPDQHSRYIQSLAIQY